MTSGPRYHDDFIRIAGGNGATSATPNDEVQLRLSSVDIGQTSNATRLAALEAATASGVGVDLQPGTIYMT